VRFTRLLYVLGSVKQRVLYEFGILNPPFFTVCTSNIGVNRTVFGSYAINGLLMKFGNYRFVNGANGAGIRREA
jgi:hypothetical protein